MKILSCKLGISSACSTILLQLFGTGIHPDDPISLVMIKIVVPRMSEAHLFLINENRTYYISSSVAADNIDAAAVVSGISIDYCLKRTERLIADIQADRARVVLISDKEELGQYPELYKRRAESRFMDIPVFLVD